MSRFLHLYRRYWPDEGGIEWTMRSFCSHLAAEGHDSQVMVASRYPWTREEVHEGVTIHRCATVGTVANTPICPTMHAVIRRLRPDLVEYQHAYPYGLWALERSGFSGPLVVHYHFDISRFGGLQALVRPLLERALDRAAVIPVSSLAYAETSPVLGPWLDKCVPITPGVEPNRFTMPDAAPAAPPAESYQLLFVGRLAPYKGISDLVQAMQWVDGRLAVVGRGPLEGKLRALATRLRVTDRVQFLGRLDDAALVRAYHACDVLVLPSVRRGEAFGIVQVEAMLCGKPVVCSDLPGVKEVGEAGVTSLTFPRGNARALAEVLSTLRDDPSRRRAMGEAGRARALANYTLDAVRRRRLELYGKVLGWAPGGDRD